MPSAEWSWSQCISWMRDNHVFLHWEAEQIVLDSAGTLWLAVIEGIRRRGLTDMPEAEDEEADAEEYMTASQALAWVADNRADLHWIHLDKEYSRLTVEAGPAGVRSVHRAVTEPDIYGFGDALVRAVQWHANSDGIERRRHRRALGLTDPEG